MMSARPKQALGSRGSVEASVPSCPEGLGGSKGIRSPLVLHPLSHRGSGMQVGVEGFEWLVPGL